MTDNLRTRIAQAFAREDAQNWGYDHGFDTIDDPETAAFVDVALAEVQPELERVRAEAHRQVEAKMSVAGQWLNAVADLGAAQSERDRLTATLQRTLRLLDSNEPVHPATLAAALTGNYCDCGGQHQPTECGGDTEPFLPDPAAVRATLAGLAAPAEQKQCRTGQNMEDCPPGAHPNPDYPWICPGPATPAEEPHTCPTCGGDGIHQIGCAT